MSFNILILDTYQTMDYDPTMVIDPAEFAYHDVDVDDSALHEDCVPRDEVFTYVVENEFEDLREAVAEDDAREWLAASADTLELLNIVSSYDREQLRAAIRDVLNLSTRPGRSASPDQFFPVATEIAKFLERTRSPYVEAYGVTESVEWVAELIDVTRIIREILFAVSENRQASSAAAKAKSVPAEPRSPSKLDQLAKALDQQRIADFIGQGVRRHLDRLNDILQQGVVYRLRPEGRKPLRVVREIDAERTPLRVSLAYWMSQYLGMHEPCVDLAVCVECGKFFARERRDNVYCSKTCQNRVAYKRKKIFVAGVLREVNARGASNELRAGLCIYHPRFGLGVIEHVQYERRRLRLRYEDPTGTSTPTPTRVIGTSFWIPEGKSAQEFFDEVKANDVRTPVGWQEVVDPASLTIAARFLSGVRRFSRWEFESGMKDVTFYAVENPMLLAELL